LDFGLTTAEAECRNGCSREWQRKAANGALCKDASLGKDQPAEDEANLLLLASFPQEDFELQGEISKGSFGTVYKIVRKGAQQDALLASSSQQPCFDVSLLFTISLQRMGGSLR
jgi:hypothetical protein